MNKNYQYKTIDMIILALEDLLEFYEEDKDRKFVSQRIDYFTHRWGDIKVGLNKPLSPNELNELSLALQTYFEIFDQAMATNKDPYREVWFNSLRETKKVLTINE